MTDRNVFRRAHSRRIGSGRIVEVGSSWAFIPDTKKRAFNRRCPECGALINTMRNPKGGYAHFEAAIGLRNVKHPCLHRGENLSKKRDMDTIDMFENT